MVVSPSELLRSRGIERPKKRSVMLRRRPASPIFGDLNFLVKFLGLLFFSKILTRVHRHHMIPQNPPRLYASDLKHELQFEVNRKEILLDPVFSRLNEEFFVF